MEIYFKQSVGCVYKNLRDPEFKTYSHYSDGKVFSSDNRSCTKGQVSLGYGIEFLILATISAVLVGLVQRFDEEARTNWFLTGLISLITAALLMLVFNVVIMILPFAAVILVTLCALAGISWMTRTVGNPINAWREYQAKKEQRIQVKLKEAQAEITRLRASDPVLNDSLKSLDAITTALLD